MECIPSIWFAHLRIKSISFWAIVITIGGRLGESKCASTVALLESGKECEQKRKWISNAIKAFWEYRHTSQHSWEVLVRYNPEEFQCMGKKRSHVQSIWIWEFFHIFVHSKLSHIHTTFQLTVWASYSNWYNQHDLVPHYVKPNDVQPIFSYQDVMLMYGLENFEQFLHSV